MPSLGALGNRVERFIVERDSFRNAVREAFTKADLDGNGVIAPREVAAISDTMFDLVEKELVDFGIPFKRPTSEHIKELLTEADKNDDFVLDEAEFFEFYRQVVKYCAAAGARGFAKRYVPSMTIGFFAVFTAKWGASKIPAVGPAVSPVLSVLPTIIIGPLLGFAVMFFRRSGGQAKLQRELFRNKAGHKGPSTSQPST